MLPRLPTLLLEVLSTLSESTALPMLVLLPTPRLLILLLLPLLLLLLRGRDVRLDLPTDSELPTPLMPPMGMLAFLMLAFLMLMAFPTTDKLLTGKLKFCAIFVFKCSMCDEHRR